MERREFIKNTGLICLGCIGATALLQSCSNAYYVQSTFDANKLVVRKSEFTEVKKGKTIQHTFVLVKTDTLQAPVYLHKFSDTDYSALLMVCTHKGCEVNPHGEYLICPCHGSEFSIRGKVQNPPAEQDLKSYTVTTDNENIFIWLS